METKPLSEVPWSTLRVGDRVISARNNNGTITKLTEKGRRNEPEIEIIWDNHLGKSIHWHTAYNAVKWIVPEAS